MRRAVPALLALALASTGCAHAARQGPPFPEGSARAHVDHGEDGRWIVREPTRLDPLAPGFVRPYPLERIYGTFGDCRPGGRQHRGLDIGGVGEHQGLGTPIRSMVRAEVIGLYRPEDDPGRWGRR